MVCSVDPRDLALVGLTILPLIPLGSHFVKRMLQIKAEEDIQHLQPSTLRLIKREKMHQEKLARRSTSKSRTPPGAPHRDKSVPGIAGRWRQALSSALRWPRTHYREHIRVAGREHMSDVDCFNGQAMRNSDSMMQGLNESAGRSGGAERGRETDDLVVIHPVLDGRLKDEGRK